MNQRELDTGGVNNYICVCQIGFSFCYVLRKLIESQENIVTYISCNEKNCIVDFIIFCVLLTLCATCLCQELRK